MVIVNNQEHDVNVPFPEDIEAHVTNLEDDQNYRITDHFIDGKKILTYTYDSQSGVGFDLININDEMWIYMPFDEDYDVEMTLKDEVNVLLPEEYRPFVDAFDFNLLDSDCGPGSILIMSEADDEWTAIKAGLGMNAYWDDLD